MTATLFRRVRLFDGVHEQVSPTCDVLVRDGVVTRISEEPQEVGDAQVLDAGARVLMPGLIDAHWHALFSTISAAVAPTADAGYLHALAAKDAERTLMRGFTTVRDVGGPVFGLRQAIDEGVLLGPRIYPSGAFISQSGGHGDFRLRTEVPRDGASPLSHAERIGAAAIADGVPEVLRAAREQLMLGASQLKVMAGGGGASPYDPLDVSQYTEEELRAAVEAADNWGTYVTVHAYTPRSVQRAIAVGVRCIEHGHLVDEPTAALIAERGVWWSLQPFLDDEDAIPLADPVNRAKQLQVTAGTDTAYELAIRHGVKLAWGTDILFDARLAERQGAMLAKMTRWFSAAEALQIATSRNAELLAMSGPRSPYQGRLGVVEEGALADLLLVDGNPVADIGLLAEPDTHLAVIMKGGAIVKNILPPRDPATDREVPLPGAAPI